MLGRCPSCRWPTLLRIGGFGSCLHCNVVLLGNQTVTIGSGSAPTYSGGDRPTRTAILTASGAILPSSNAPTRSTVTGTNFAYTVLDYPLVGTASQAYWILRMPNGFDGTADITVLVYWKGDAASTNPTWGIAGLGRIEGEAWDTALGTENTAADSQAAAADLATTSITWTAANHGLAAGDIAVVRIRRTAGGTGNARFLGAELRYLITE